MKITVNKNKDGVTGAWEAFDETMNGIVQNCLTPLTGRGGLLDQYTHQVYGPGWGHDYWKQPIFNKSDLYVKDSVLVAEVEMPGFKSEEIEVNLHDLYLQIKATRTAKEGKADKWITIERENAVTVSRSFNIKDKIDTDKIEAAYEQGVLTVKMPLVEPVKPSILKIKVK